MLICLYMKDLCGEIKKFGKGVGNTSRYKIIESLFSGPKTVNGIVKTVKLSQPAVSQHLRTLKESDIVLDEKCGQEVIYTLNTKHILELLKFLTKEVGSKKK